MHFYLPRRHRRPLLLPPGLLALAGLLLLGCLALRPWQEQAKTHGVIELTMPIYEARPSFPIIKYLLPNPDTLCRQCIWHDANLTGNRMGDSLQHLRIAGYVRAMTTYSVNDGGLRVRLSAAAHYRSMVYLLDLMNRTNIRYFWFDIRHKPMTFYAIRTVPNPVMEYGLYDDIQHIPIAPLPFWARFNNAINALWQPEWLEQWWLMKQRELRQPEWYTSLAMLALVLLLNGQRLWASWQAKQEL